MPTEYSQFRRAYGLIKRIFFLFFFQKSEAPLARVEVVVLSTDEGIAELLLDDDEDLAVPAELLQHAIGGGNEETFTEEGSKMLLIKRRGRG